MSSGPAMTCSGLLGNSWLTPLRARRANAEACSLVRLGSASPERPHSGMANEISMVTGAARAKIPGARRACCTGQAPLLVAAGGGRGDTADYQLNGLGG